MTHEKVGAVLDALEGLYPEAQAELHFTNPYETLIATILSAQCTDRRVNQVTEPLLQALSRCIRHGKAHARGAGAAHLKAADCIIIRQRTSSRPVERWSNSITARCRATAKSSWRCPAWDKRRRAWCCWPPSATTRSPWIRMFSGFHVASAWPTRRRPRGVEKQLRDVLPRERWSHAHHLLIWHGRRMLLGAQAGM